MKREEQAAASRPNQRHDKRTMELEAPLSLNPLDSEWSLVEAAQVDR